MQRLLNVKMLAKHQEKHSMLPPCQQKQTLALRITPARSIHRREPSDQHEQRVYVFIYKSNTFKT